MQAHIGKWGTSLAVRIPAAYAKALGLKEGMKLEISVLNRGMLLRPAQKKYSLEELVADITPENLHERTDWGASVGREAW